MSLPILSRLKKTQPHIYDLSHMCFKCNNNNNETWIYVFLYFSQIDIFQQCIISLQQQLVDTTKNYISILTHF